MTADWWRVVKYFMLFKDKFGKMVNAAFFVTVEAVFLISVMKMLAFWTARFMLFQIVILSMSGTVFVMRTWMKNS